ncbi:uncharacterized protein LOC134228617 [Saccostrea cucullata]|uniref:uncharacterized protein LOC134228617 n=1 Tax=Saccostrea cuccullata TaxID=36930 RepID=UPI002ED6ACC3
MASASPDNRQRAFLRYVYRQRCVIPMSEAEKLTIEPGIRQMLGHIVQRVGEKNPVFKISDILSSGSFYEGTKIRNFDEFDFMVILQIFSEPDRINIQKGCSDWYTKLQLKTDQKEKLHPYMCYCTGVSLYTETFYNRYENYFRNPKDLISSFWNTISEVTESNSFHVDILEGTLKPTKIEKEKLPLVYVKRSGVSDLKYDKYSETLVKVERTHIGVDLMMALEHPYPAVVNDLPGFPSEFQDLLLKHGCHIITKSCHVDHSPHPSCWFISFARMELELMKNMDEHHKYCYKILKALLIEEINLSGKCMNLSSYVLKTAFLFHVYDDKCTHSRLDITCINSVLDYMSSCFHKIRMPCFFARDMNVWGHVLKFPCFGWGWPGLSLSGGRYQKFALLWIKFWYRIVQFVKSTLSEERIPKMDGWISVLDKFDYTKKTIYYLINRYLSNEEAVKGALTIQELAEVNLDSCSDEDFATYIKELQNYYNIKLDFLLTENRN